MKRYILFFCLFLFSISLVSGAKLHGSIYDLNLTKQTNVIVEINTVPKQQYLAKTGEFAFEVPIGTYTIKAGKGTLVTTDTVKITGEGTFIFDLFLFPSLEEEDELLKDLSGISVEDNIKKSFFSRYPWWSFVGTILVFAFAIWRILRAEKKYGKLPKVKLFGRKKKPDEPLYLDEALKIIKKNDGRITQKELRKEMMLSLLLQPLIHLIHQANLQYSSCLQSKTM